MYFKMWYLLYKNKKKYTLYRGYATEDISIMQRQVLGSKYNIYSRLLSVEFFLVFYTYINTYDAHIDKACK